MNNKQIRFKIYESIKPLIKQKIMEELDVSKTVDRGALRKTGVQLGKDAGAKGIQPKERGIVQQVIEKLQVAAENGAIDQDPGVRRALKLLDAALSKISGGGETDAGGDSEVADELS